MGRPKLENTLSKYLPINMEPKLYSQLKRYADKNDNGIISVSARRALKLFLSEEEEKK